MVAPLENFSESKHEIGGRFRYTKKVKNCTTSIQLELHIFSVDNKNKCFSD